MEEKLFDVVLHVGLNAPVVQKFLLKHSRVYHFLDITKVRDFVWFNAEILRLNSKLRPNLNFFQIQHGNPIFPTTLQNMYGVTVNWSGDVRDPIPDIFSKTGKYFDYNMLTNTTDVEILQNRGIRANYLQIGLDSEDYCKEYTIPEFDMEKKEIVFLANNYHSIFPLSPLRREVVIKMKEKYGNRFGLYGSGWADHSEGALNNMHSKELFVYRNSKIAINLSHFDYKRYSSDRIFRIMGSGAFCLTKWYPDIEMDFTDGEHLVVWKTIDELLEKIEYYLNNTNERNRIAQNGYDLVHKFHTWDERLFELKRIIENNEKYHKKYP